MHNAAPHWSEAAYQDIFYKGNKKILDMWGLRVIICYVRYVSCQKLIFFWGWGVVRLDLVQTFWLFAVALLPPLPSASGMGGVDWLALSVTYVIR